MPNEWMVSDSRFGWIPRWRILKLVSSDFMGSRWVMYQVNGKPVGFLFRSEALSFAENLNCGSDSEQ